MSKIIIGGGDALQGVKRINIDTDGQLTGHGVKVTTENGETIHGVRRAVITIDPKQMIVAELEIFSAFKGKALADFCVMDPMTSKLKPVKRIEFEDGSTFEPK